VAKATAQLCPLRYLSHAFCLLDIKSAAVGVIVIYERVYRAILLLDFYVGVKFESHIKGRTKVEDV
jgi:hypothetical protein